MAKKKDDQIFPLLPREKPWLRLPGETPSAYNAFSMYLLIPGGERRSVAHAYRQRSGKEKKRQAPRIWWQWHRKFRWRERALLFDHYAVEKSLEAEIAERESARNLRRRKAEEMIWAGAELLDHIMKRAKEDPDSIRLNEVVSLLKEGLEQLRKDWNDQPTERIAVGLQQEVKFHLSKDELGELDSSTIIDLYETLDGFVVGKNEV